MLSQTSSGTNHRRSSILKPPKSRQPFQDLDFNNSTPVTTPESTKKRRVSFAEKKHIKEFCDHKEQGTIWDSTYEEADQNISKLADNCNDNVASNNLEIEYRENVNIPMQEAGFKLPNENHDIIGSTTYVTMNPNSADNSSTKIFFNSHADIELTDVIPSRQKIYDDVELETTEVVSRIEPPTSVKKMLSFPLTQEIVNEDIQGVEKTILFDDRDGDMMFTKVISSKHIKNSIPPNINPCSELENMNSLIENQTVLFEDSGMDFTLPESHLESGLDLRENKENNCPQIGGDAMQNKIVNSSSSCKENQYDIGNKTILFNDFGCEITKAIDTMQQKLPPVSLSEDKISVESNKPQNIIYSETTNVNVLLNQSDSYLRNTATCNKDASKLIDKTIFYDNITCELTKAVDMLRPNLCCDTNVEVNDSKQILPSKIPVMNPKIKVVNESKADEFSSKHDHPESQSKLIAGDGNCTKFFDEFIMDFTTAITRTKNLQDEVKKTNQLVISNSSQLRDVAMDTKVGKSKNNFLNSEPNLIESSVKAVARNDDQTKFLDQSAMDFTTAITTVKNSQDEVKQINQSTVVSNNSYINISTNNPKSNSVMQNISQSTNLSLNNLESSDLHCDEEARCDKNPENIDSKECRNSLVNNNSERNVTTEVKVAPQNSNSLPNLEGQNDPTNAGLASIEPNNNKKRKSIQGTEVDTSKCSNNILTVKNIEHDLFSVQCSAYEQSIRVINDNLSNNFVTNCKRLKIANTNTNSEENNSHFEIDPATTNCRLQENFGNISPSTTDKVHKEQNLVSTDEENVKNYPTDLTVNDLESNERISVSPPLDCQETHEKLRPDTNEEVEEISFEDINCQEEPSFMEELGSCSSSDPDLEIFELSNIYEKRRLSIVESNNEKQNCSELINNDFENNDDCCFMMFREELEKNSQSADCIWQIRSLERNMVLIDFISKSLVIAIYLEPNKELTSSYIIEDIKIISLLSDSTDENMSMVHSILLTKLKSENFKQLHRTTRDILPLLDVISQKVKLVLDFMYEFDKLQDFHLMKRSGNQISFCLHSYKVQLVIKFIIDIKLLEDIGPNDVTVEFVLGNTNIKDIKQLMSSVKKDHKFLTNYIHDVKEYIELVAEK